jgi:hypothetical protein
MRRRDAKLLVMDDVAVADGRAVLELVESHPDRRPGQQTGSKRLNSTSLNHAESNHEKPAKPHE